jgi:hypothetical protein
MRTVALFLLRLILGGGNEMAVIYATLIVKGYKTICDVPKLIRNDVRQVLIQLDAGHLAEPTCADETV